MYREPVSQAHAIVASEADRGQKVDYPFLDFLTFFVTCRDERQTAMANATGHANTAQSGAQQLCAY
jgi:hypothetical protein